MKNVCKEFLKKSIPYGVLVVMPIVCFYLMEFMLRNPFEKMKGPLQWLNILFFELFALFLFFAFRSVKIAIRIEAAVSLFIGLLTYFVVSFRGAPVMPWDIFSIKTAASVANNYEYRLSGKVAWIVVLFILIIILCSFIKNKPKMTMWLRIGGALLTAAGLVMATLYVQTPKAVKDFKIYDKLFTPLTMTYKDGTVVAFLLECQYLSVEKPAGYQEKKVEEILASYDTADDELVSKSDLPNVIVIMNEAFSDLSILGNYTTNESVMPFVKSLMENGENTISGYMDVSVLGGNTANTEFEFLTGDTMAFLPQGCIPYQQYVKDETDSIATSLKELGYYNVAMHPYNATGWDRDKVYQRFAFDEFIALDAFDGAELLRKYVSDRADYEKLIEVYEGKESGKPLFMFNVTMQNHSSYTDLFDNFTPNIVVEGVDSVALNQYLSLIKESDRAIEELVTYFDNQEEDTIIVFFGDHQPTDSVVSPIYKLNGGSVYSLTEEEQRLRYQVPYFIHANFDIEEKYGKQTSANFLGIETLQAAGIPLTAYQNYMMDLKQEYDSISVMQTTTTEGVVESISDTKDKLQVYQQLQYYHLFH